MGMRLWTLGGGSETCVMQLTFNRAYNAVEFQTNSCTMRIGTPATGGTDMLKRFMLLTLVVGSGLVMGGSAMAQTHPHPKAGTKAEDQGKAAASSAAALQAKVKQVYTFDCAMCHGASGDGKTDLATSMKLTLSDWTDPKSLAGKTDDQLIAFIRKGNDKMPPEDKSRASDDEVKGLVAYIRGFAKGTASAGTPAAAPSPAPASTTPPPSN
jgi:cytochrome c5